MPNAESLDEQLTFLEEEPNPPFDPPHEFETIFLLLKEVTSIGVVRDFLRGKGLQHSANSWEDLREKRLLESLRKNEISISDLKSLLSEVEEFGRSHIFLYQYDNADEVVRPLLDQVFVSQKANALGLSDCLGVGKVLNQPDDPTITSIRIEDDPRGKCLVIKIIEKRVRQTFVREKARGKYIARFWEVDEIRAVNVVRLWEFGLLEVRISSHRNSVKYDNEKTRIFTLVNPFLPGAERIDFPLWKTKLELWEKKEEYKEMVQFCSTKLIDSTGATIVGSSGSDDESLLSNAGLSNGLDAFMQANAEPTCESANLYWLPQDGGLPSTKVHVILPEISNEFAVSKNCSKMDYDYVFDKLRELSD